MLNALICSLKGHDINRRKVWNDGLDFRTRCTRCDARLIRLDEGWVAYVPERDDDPRRNHPPRAATEILAPGALAGDRLPA